MAEAEQQQQEPAAEPPKAVKQKEVIGKQKFQKCSCVALSRRRPSSFCTSTWTSFWDILVYAPSERVF